MPSLGDLQEGDLKYQVDYRSLYATVMGNWWGIPGTEVVGQEYQAVNCLTWSARSVTRLNLLLSPAPERSSLVCRQFGILPPPRFPGP